MDQESWTSYILTGIESLCIKMKGVSFSVFVNQIDIMGGFIFIFKIPN